MIAEGALSKEIDTLEELRELIRYQKARIDKHAPVDEKSPIARREQSNDIKLMKELLELYDAKMKDEKGAKSTPEIEKGKGVKSFKDYSPEEEEAELLRIVQLEVKGKESRERAI